MLKAGRKEMDCSIEMNGAYWKCVGSVEMGGDAKSGEINA